MAHIFWTRVLLHKLQRNKLSKRRRRSAGRRTLALSLFEKWYKSFTRTCHSQLHQHIDFQDFKDVRESDAIFSLPSSNYISITFHFTRGRLLIRFGFGYRCYCDPYLWSFENILIRLYVKEVRILKGKKVKSYCFLGVAGISLIYKNNYFTNPPCKL